MHSLFFYIGLGLGLAVAAGLRPFAPALLAGALGSGNVLDVDFQRGDFTFLQSSGWLIAVAAVFLAVWIATVRIGSDRLEAGPLGAAVSGIAVGVGALLFAGTLSDHHDASWPGLIGGAAAAALTAAAVRPMFARARARLGDATARNALGLYLDGAALVVAALTCLLHPLGYVALAGAVWLVAASRRRAGEKYAGLRILRD